MQHAALHRRHVCKRRAQPWLRLFDFLHWIAVLCLKILKIYPKPGNIPIESVAYINQYNKQIYKR
jgi:hypothetical protein